MSVDRINSEDRLAGDAKPIGTARTASNYELAFTVWSRNNNCAAADLIAGIGRPIHGVLYSIPKELIERTLSKKIGRRSLDEIEGERKNYTRIAIEVVTDDKQKITATTYVVKDRKTVSAPFFL